MLKTGLLLFLFIALDSNALDITQAWQLVQEKNDGLKAGKQGIEHAKVTKEGSDSMMYMPSIDLHGSYTHLSKPIELSGGTLDLNLPALPPIDLPPIDLSEQDVFLANVSILWPIFSGGKTLYLADITAAQIDAEKSKLELLRQKAFIQLVKYYYGAKMGKAYYETRLEVEEAFFKHYDHAQKMQVQGTIAKVELLNAKVKYEKAKIETIKAHHKFSIASSALKKLLKEDEFALDSSLFINEDINDKEYYISMALENYPALHILDAKHKQSDSLVSMQKSSYLPTVVAFGNYNLYKDDSIISSTLPDWFAGAAININLLSATGRSEKFEAAKIISSQIALLQAQAKQDLAILVEQTYNELMLYLDEYKALDASLELANENVKLRRIAFESGLSTSLELNDAELFLAGTKTERLLVAYEYVQKLSQLMILSQGSERFMELALKGEEVRK